MRKLVVPLLVGLLLMQGCILPKPNPDRAAEMNRLEIALRRLGAAVEGQLWSGAQRDADLIALACANDPSLCSALGGNKTRVRVVDGHSVLLLCSPDNRLALVEDIACTPKPDRKAWTDGNAPCEFVLSDQQIREVCR